MGAQAVADEHVEGMLLVARVPQLLVVLVEDHACGERLRSARRPARVAAVPVTALRTLTLGSDDQAAAPSPRPPAEQSAEAKADFYQSGSERPCTSTISDAFSLVAQDFQENHLPLTKGKGT